MVTIAARLEGLAAPNIVGMSQVTVRRTPGAFLEDWGLQVLKDADDLTGVFRVLRPIIGAGVPCLIGRYEELGWLVRRWEQNSEDRSQVVLGMGQEPGARRGRREVTLGGSRLQPNTLRK
jgi:hypothetical protein